MSPSTPETTRCWQSVVGTIALAWTPSTTTVEALGAGLPPEELALAAAFGVRRRQTFIMGRTVLRSAFRAAFPEVPGVAEVLRNVIHRDDRGAPIMVLPSTMAARVSITHKDDVVAALVRPMASTLGGATSSLGIDDSLGLDLEHRDGRSAVELERLARQVLRPEELASLPSSRGHSDDERNTYAAAVMARFSLKEAVYKAIDPHLRRYVGFLEVGVSPSDENSSVNSNVEEGHRWRVDLSDVDGAAPLEATGYVLRSPEPSLVLTGCVVRKR